MSHIPYFSKDATFTTISERLMALHPGIDLGKHIAHGTKEFDEKLEIGPTTSEGVSFVPRDPVALRMAIVAAKNESGLSAFHYDNRKNWIFRLAAVATHGGGYREIGSPSLHCAIATDICNIHLDDFGFVAIGNDGKTYFTPDSLPHIVDELAFRVYVRNNLRKLIVGGLGENLATPATLLLDRSYLALPTLSKLNMSKLTHKVDLRAGIGLKLAQTQTVQMRFEATCGNRHCSDGQYMVTLDVDLNKLANKFRK